MARSRGLPGRAAHVLVPLLSLGVALVAGEAALRLLYSSPPGLHFSVRPMMYRMDAELAYSLRPGVDFVWGTREFTERVHVNAEGFRDAAPAPWGSEARIPRDR